ncbi:MAG: aromatic ring-hydroxylating dioxygenase subunit alpha [Rhodoferax sp.]|nr:aromatic ring-hydroxylating dioxygenase subunit alpha [Rhodoferax sp.]
MSDLSLRLQQSASQLPVHSYFDDAIYRVEQQRIFQAQSRYVGHVRSVPEIGDYYTLPQESAGRALVRAPTGVQLISNVCRHRQALILQGRGSLLTQQPGSAAGNLVCPLHRWTYSGGSADTKAGTLLRAPHFAQDPCLNLENYPLQEWNGLLFEPPKLSVAAAATDMPRSRVAADLARLGPIADLDFSSHVLDHVQLHECNYNWKTFIEVYLEDYHVGPFHPGLGSFVTCEDLRWEFGEHYCVQTVGVANRLGKAGSPVYERWQESLLNYRDGKPPKYGAIWLAYYPHTMVEWYPHVLTVSTLYPRGPDKTLNVVEFYYPEEIAAFERDFVQAQQAAYMETCVEDDEIALRMDAGRRALMQRGVNERGPYQSPMEDGMQHFHEWYRGVIGPGVLDNGATDPV